MAVVSAPRHMQRPLVHQELLDVIDDDIVNTVCRILLASSGQHGSDNNQSLQLLIGKSLQAERNHWKDRLQLSMQEIDRQHRVILAAQTGLQEVQRWLRHTHGQPRTAIPENEEETADQGVVVARLIDNIKSQIRELKMKPSIASKSKPGAGDNLFKQKQDIIALKETISKLENERERLGNHLQLKSNKIQWLQGEINKLRRHQGKMHDIISRYNESHTGANFHLKIVENLGTAGRSVLNPDTQSNSSSHVRERTYIEGDQIMRYPTAGEEDAVLKDRLKKHIYSARQGSSKSGVAQCLRCQKLFKSSENNRRACRFHHKGREIREQLDENGRCDISKVSYKWACCKTPLETPGCMFSYHV